MVCPRRLVRGGGELEEGGIGVFVGVGTVHKPGLVWPPEGGLGSVRRFAFPVVPAQTDFVKAD